MTTQKSTLKLKVILWVSGSALFMLSTQSSIDAKWLMLHVIEEVFLTFALYKLQITHEKARLYLQPQYYVLGGLLAAELGWHFYYRVSIADAVAGLKNQIGIKVNYIIACAAAVGSAATMIFCGFVIGWFIEEYVLIKLEPKLRPVLGELSFGRAFAVIFIIYAAALFSLLRANFDYMDDLGRVYGGYDDWNHFSRFLTTLLSHFVHVSGFLTDISPLPQLMAVGIMAFASLIVIKAIKGCERFSLWDIIAAVPLGLNPYFLQCFSYKYDAPYMALSVLAAAAPIAWRKKGTKKYVLAIFIGTLVMCTTYQASSGIFPMLVALLAFIEWNRGEDIKQTARFVGVSAAGYLAGLLFFMLFVMKAADTYVSNSVGSFMTILHNYGRYLKYVISDFRRLWLLMILALVAWFIIAAVQNSRRGKFASLLIGGIISGVMFALSFGMYPALSKSLFSPRAMYGVGVFIALMGLGNLSEHKMRYITRALTVILAWCFITFAATYGNALAEQDRYMDYRINEVMSSLTELEEFNGEGDKTIQLVGSAGYSPVVNEMVKSDYTMLARLVLKQFGGDYGWGDDRFMYYTGLSQYAKYSEEVDITDYDTWPLLHESCCHAIYAKNGHFVIELK